MQPIIIETPKGSSQKYTYDPATRLFKLKKSLPAGMVFPYDFGFIPGTKGEDGDPLDVLLLNEVPGFPGCLIDATIIGCLRGLQKETGSKKIRNDRFIATTEHSKIFGHLKKLKNLAAQTLIEIEDFFVQYQLLEGKQFTIEERAGAAKAMQLIQTNRKNNE